MHDTLRYGLRLLRSARHDCLQILMLLLGILVGTPMGMAASLQWKADVIPFEIADTIPPLATVVIEDAPTGTVEGHIADDPLSAVATGTGRVLLGNDLVANGSGTFKGVMRGSLPKLVEVPVPAGMHYVASKNGKKFYGVTSSMGNRILPKNRVYFPDRTAAIAAGFKA